MNKRLRNLFPQVYIKRCKTCTEMIETKKRNADASMYRLEQNEKRGAKRKEMKKHLCGVFINDI